MIGYIIESNTQLFRAESILKKKGIECSVVATPMKYSPKGCTMSIMVEDDCMSILTENNISVAGEWHGY